ncbi:MAG: hypothetical protein WAW39_27395 [Prosthecobacter sp.]|uniref:hypothetical protein n=1 Tax=Prosthecobacter sp. TaxID=1965333 RepID=UPI003BB112F3
MSTPNAITTSIPVEVTGLSKTEHEVLLEIMADIKRSLDGIRKAAARWVELPEKARAKIVEQTRPSLRDFWAKLERVGSGMLHPQLATVSGLAAKYLGKLGIEDQERFLREGLPVVEVKRGKYDTRMLDVVMMSEEQRKQVFRVVGQGCAVRTVEEQQAWLADQAAKRLLRQEAADRLKKVDRVGWSVQGGKVFVKPARVEAGLTLRDLETMMKDLKS